MLLHITVPRVLCSTLMLVLLITNSHGQIGFHDDLETKRHFLNYAPSSIESVRQAYQTWNESKSDTSLPEKHRNADLQKLVNSVMMHDMQFIRVYNEDLAAGLHDEESIDFYDETVQLDLRWYLHFLESSTWSDLQAQLAAQPWRHKSWTDTISDPADLLLAQKRTYDAILDAAIARPEKFRRRYHERFWRYDEPPSPQNGFAALQQQINLLNLPADSSIVLLFSLDVSENGEILRIMSVSGHLPVLIKDRITAVLTSQTWHPAQRKGKAFRATAQIPVCLMKSVDSD